MKTEAVHWPSTRHTTAASAPPVTRVLVRQPVLRRVLAASLAAAGDWWDEALDRLQQGEILAEALWSFEDQPAARFDDAEGRRLFDDAVAGVDGEGPDDSGLKEHWLMGRAMPALRGRVAGATVRTWVKEVLA